MLKKPHTLKKCQVVMLQSNKKAQLSLSGKWLFNGESDREPKPINQHLYIISNDEIKENDWFIKMNYKGGKPTVYKENKSAFMNSEWLNSDDVKDCFKIIATTDSSLEIISKGINPVYQKLPQPSQQFIEKYIEEYNKGNQILDVLVEYEYRHDDSVPYPKTLDGESVLKVNSKDNTITIKKVKDSYSRDEVIRLLINHTINLRNKTNDLDFTNNWIQKNL